MVKAQGILVKINSRTTKPNILSVLIDAQLLCLQFCYDCDIFERPEPVDVSLMRRVVACSQPVAEVSDPVRRPPLRGRARRALHSAPDQKVRLPGARQGEGALQIHRSKPQVRHTCSWGSRGTKI